MNSLEPIDHSADVVSVGLEELQVFSRAVMLRLPLRIPELRRIGRIKDALTAASELNKALSAYIQHALVDCHGSHGTADLAKDAAALFDALSRYTSELQKTAEEYRSLVLDFGTSSLDLEEESADRSDRSGSSL